MTPMRAPLEDMKSEAVAAEAGLSVLAGAPDYIPGGAGCPGGRMTSPLPA